MKVVQINAVYGILSTGKNTKELHYFLKNNGVDSYVFYGENKQKKENQVLYVGNWFTHKVSAFLNRLTGKYFYHCNFDTRLLEKKIKKIHPDIVLIGNLHSNFVNIPKLLAFLAKEKISTFIVLHDCFFFTGGCCHYTINMCYKWKTACESCRFYTSFSKNVFNRNMASQNFIKMKNIFDSFNDLNVIGVSKWITSSAGQSIILKNARSFNTIYNWIDLDTFFSFDKSTIFADGVFDESLFYLIGVAAEWREDKNYSLFLDVADNLRPDERIILVGRCNNKIKNGKIIYIDRTNDAKALAKLYNIAGVLLQLSKQETFGKVVAESLACGTPVITNASTANPELVDESTGIVLKELTVNCVLDAISKIKKNGKSFYSFSCRKRAQELFSLEKNANKYMLLFEKTCDKKMLNIEEN